MGSVRRKLHDAQRDHFHREFLELLIVIVKTSPVYGLRRYSMNARDYKFETIWGSKNGSCALEILCFSDKNKPAIINDYVQSVTHPSVGPADKNSPRNLIVDWKLGKSESWLGKLPQRRKRRNMRGILMHFHRRQKFDLNFFLFFCEK